MQIAAIIFAVVGVTVIILMFMRSRAREGIRPFEVTSEDRAQLQELRHELSIRRIVGRVTGTLGGILLVGAMAAPFFPDSPYRTDWRTAVYLLSVGVVLVIAAALLLRPQKRKHNG